MGLAIVQRQYDGQGTSSVAASPSSPDEPEKKKRKIGNPLKGLIYGLGASPLEDDEFFPGSGKKSKGGIGYAGNVKEDVSTFGIPRHCIC